MRAALLLTFYLVVGLLQGQVEKAEIKNLCLNLHLDKKYESFVIGIDNPLDIVYGQDEKISKDDVTVVFRHYKSNREGTIEVRDNDGYLTIRPDSLGWITIKVQTSDGLKERTVKTKPLVAVGRLSRYYANREEKIKSGEFRAQFGLVASIEGYDICGKCTVIDYEIIRISTKKIVDKSHNVGGRFEKKSQDIIRLANSGDLYIFRNIYYECPGDERKKRLADMIFEIE